MNSLLLTICIPTFKNVDVLSQNVSQLTSYIKHFEDIVEIVITENFSSRDESEEVLKLRSNVVKVFTNSQNLGFAKNLLLSLSHSQGKFLMLLGDDDFVDQSLIHDLIQYLSGSDSKKLLLLPLSDHSVSAYQVSAPYVFMRAGQMMGLVFNQNAIRLSELKTDCALYSQIELAMSVFFEQGAKLLASSGKIMLGDGLPLEQRFSDKMSRPLDFGIVERFYILQRLLARYSFGRGIYLKCYLSLLTWGNNIFFKLRPKKPTLAMKFAFANFIHNPDKLSFVCLELYLATKLVISKIFKFKKYS